MFTEHMSLEKPKVSSFKTHVITLSSTRNTQYTLYIIFLILFINEKLCHICCYLVYCLPSRFVAWQVNKIMLKYRN